MKKKIAFLISLILLSLLFMSCPLDGNGWDFSDLGTYDEKTAWTKSFVDTARSATYLSDLEKDVILEINKARTNPRAYAALYLLPYVTNGTASNAMKECIMKMKIMKPIVPLQPGKGLTLAAKEWVALQGPSEYIGHDMNFPVRLRKYGYYSGWPGENISYGRNDPKEIVITLLEDDGVWNRGHRNNILNPGFAYIGVGFGPHKKYGYMCVQDFTERYKDK